MPTLRRILTALAIVVGCLAHLPHAEAQRGRRRPASKDDVARLEARLAAQEQLVSALIALQRQYLEQLVALSTGHPVTPLSTPPAPAGDPSAAGPSVTVATGPAAKEPAAASKEPAAGAKEPVAAKEPAAKEPPGAKEPAVAAAGGKGRKPARVKGEVGTLVGKVTGAGDAIIYLEDLVSTGRGKAEMRQQGKQFVPSVLVVQKGTTVAFPNLDAIFHNVFSVSPDHSFDLGSYRQGDSRSVHMTRPGVVTVYCNMHPQMVGYILVVPNGRYVRAGPDGFFRMPDVPVGSHRVVAWAPNAKPAKVDAVVATDQVVTLEFALKKSGSTAHVKKNGMPYGSYEQ